MIIMPKNNIMVLKIKFNGMKKWNKIEIKLRKNNPKIPVSPIELCILFSKKNFWKKNPYPTALK